jgi:hypothetical protein
MIYNKSLIVLFFLFMIIFLLKKSKNIRGGYGLDNMSEGPEKKQSFNPPLSLLYMAITQLDIYAKKFEKNYITKKYDKNDSYMTKITNNYIDNL